MSKKLPLDEMLSQKDDSFKELFIMTMNLYLGSSIGKPIAEKDRTERILKLIEDNVKKTK